MNEVSTEKTMTVKEVAEVLGYQPDTIQKTAKGLLWLTKKYKEGK